MCSTNTHLSFRINGITQDNSYKSRPIAGSTARCRYKFR